MKPFTFKESLLPEGFQFPPDYEQLVRSGAWPDLAPWSFLALDMAASLSYYGGMLLKFPGRPLIPFAIVSDASGLYNDGLVVLACFDGSDISGQPPIRIYDYSTPKKSPWDNLSYTNFVDWIEAAKKESARYKAERAEIESDG